MNQNEDKETNDQEFTGEVCSTPLHTDINLSILQGAKTTIEAFSLRAKEAYSELSTQLNSFAGGSTSINLAAIELRSATQSAVKMFNSVYPVTFSALQNGNVMVGTEINTVLNNATNQISSITNYRSKVIGALNSTTSIGIESYPLLTRGISGTTVTGLPVSFSEGAIVEFGTLVNSTKSFMNSNSITGMLQSASTIAYEMPSFASYLDPSTRVLGTAINGMSLTKTMLIDTLDSVSSIRIPTYIPDDILSKEEITPPKKSTADIKARMKKTKEYVEIELTASCTWNTEAMPSEISSQFIALAEKTGMTQALVGIEQSNVEAGSFNIKMRKTIPINGTFFGDGYQISDSGLLFKNGDSMDIKLPPAATYLIKKLLKAQNGLSKEELTDSPIYKKWGSLRHVIRLIKKECGKEKIVYRNKRYYLS